MGAQHHVPLHVRLVAALPLRHLDLQHLVGNRKCLLDVHALVVYHQVDVLLAVQQQRPRLVAALAQLAQHAVHAQFGRVSELLVEHYVVRGQLQVVVEKVRRLVHGFAVHLPLLQGVHPRRKSRVPELVRPQQLHEFSERRAGVVVGQHLVQSPNLVSQTVLGVAQLLQGPAAGQNALLGRVVAGCDKAPLCAGPAQGKKALLPHPVGEERYLEIARRQHGCLRDADNLHPVAALPGEEALPADDLDPGEALADEGERGAEGKRVALAGRDRGVPARGGGCRSAS